MHSVEHCPKGTVTAITMTNFSTFDNKRTVRPGPGLNVICGPNGSGKSSVVSAICVGLGFPVKDISNRGGLTSFISHSASFCEIEIQLSNGGVQRSTFKRKFFRNKNTRDVFMIDDERIPTRKAYLKYVQDNYNIRLDNSTQYLPQSKLEEFRKMDGKERLLRTLEVIRPEMLAQKEEIMKIDEQRANDKRALEGYEKIMASAKKKLDQLATQQKAIRQHLTSSRDIHLLQLGIMHREWEDEVDKTREAKKRVKDVKRSLREAARATQAAAEAVGVTEKACTDEQATYHEMRKTVVASVQAIKAKSKDTHTAIQDVSTTTAEFNDLTTDLERNERRQETEQQLLQSLEAKMQEVRDKSESKENLNAERIRFNKEICAKVQNLQRLRQSREEKDGHIRAINQQRESMKRDRERKNEHVSRDAKYVQCTTDKQRNENRRLIDLKKKLQAANTRDPVFGPLATHFWATKAAYAPVIANAIKCKRAFAASNDADEKLLRRMLAKDNLHKLHGVRTLLISNDAIRRGSQDTPPFKVTDAMRSLGILGWVSEIVEASSDVVLEAIRSSSYIHTQLYGDAKCDNASNIAKIEELIAQAMRRPGTITLHILTAPTPRRWTYKKSKYDDGRYCSSSFATSRQISTRDTPVFMPTDARLDSELRDIDTRLDELATQRTELIDQLKALDRDIKDARADHEDLSKQQKEVIAKITEWNRLEREIESRKQSLAHVEEEIERDRSTLPQRQAEVKEKIDHSRREFEEYFTDTLGSFKTSWVDKLMASAIQGIKAAHFSKRMPGVVHAHECAEKEERALETELQEAKEQCQLQRAKRDDSKYSTLRARYPAWTCELLPPPVVEEGADPFERTNTTVTCACPPLDEEPRRKRKNGSDDQPNKPKCRNQIATSLAKKFTSHAFTRVQPDGSTKTYTIAKADLHDLRKLLQYLQQSSAQGQDLQELRKKHIEVTKAIATQKAHILNMQKDSDDKAEQLRTKFGDHDRNKENWLAELKAIVEKLHKRFDKLMNQIGNRGKWEVLNAGSPQDTDLSTLEMKLTASFHAKPDGTAGDLLELPRLSGGENSVTTCVALIAVQQLFPAPFRIADEVNQGMDEMNRSLTFQLLTRRPKTTSRDHGKQFFILTPKLLRGISYDRDDVKAIVLVNGPDVTWDGQTPPNLASIIQYRKRRLASPGKMRRRPSKRKSGHRSGRKTRARISDDDDDDE